MLNVDLPHDEIAERAVLGGLIADPSLFSIAREHSLEKGDFYFPIHAELFEFLEELYMEKGEGWDDIVFFSEAEKRGKNWAKAFIYSLVEEASTGYLFKSACQRVKELSILRKAKEKALKLLQAQDLEEVRQIYGGFEEIFTAKKEELIDVSRLASQVYERIRANRERDALVSGFSTGYLDLDKAIDGLHEGHLVIVGARPGMGKSSFMLCLALQLARQGYKTLIFSLEMSAQELGERMFSILSGVPLSSIRSGFLSDEDMDILTDTALQIRNLPIVINDAGSLSPMDIKLSIRDVKPHVVFVDYLQLVRYEKAYASRQEEVAYISRSLKAMAKDLNVCVVALSQLSRNVEHRADKRPTLADLRESGQIEQDADLVMFLHRPDYYKKEKNNDNKVELILAKNRHGPTGIVNLTFVPSTTAFLPYTGQTINTKEENDEFLDDELDF